MSVKLSLATVPLFQFMPPDELKRLAAAGKIVEKNAGDLVVMHGEPVPGIFLVGEGSAGVHATKPNRLIATLGVGESFGEMSYLENAKASATIRAEERATKLILFTHAELKALIDADPLLGRCLFQGIALQLSKKLRNTTAKLAHELAVEGDLLKHVHGADHAGKERAAFLAEIGGFRQDVLGQLDGSLIAVEELGKKITDRPGSLNDLTLRLTELRAKTRAFLPKLEAQVGGMTRVLTRLGELVAHAAE